MFTTIPDMIDEPLTPEEEAELRRWATEQADVPPIPADGHYRIVARLLATLDESRLKYSRWVGVTYGREASDSVLLYREDYDKLQADKSALTTLLSTMRGIATDRTVSSLENARLVARKAVERADAAIAEYEALYPEHVAG